MASKYARYRNRLLLASMLPLGHLAGPCELTARVGGGGAPGDVRRLIKEYTLP